MKATHKLFYMFYSMTSDEGSMERYIKTCLLITLLLTLCLCVMVVILVQYLKFRPNSFVFWILMIICNAGISYLWTSKYYIKSGRYKKIIRFSGDIKKEKQTFFAMMTFSAIMLALVILYVIGMVISYIYVINH